MAFVRQFRQGGRTYYAKVEAYRDEQGRPRQRVVKWLGTTPTETSAETPTWSQKLADAARAVIPGKSSSVVRDGPSRGQVLGAIGMVLLLLVSIPTAAVYFTKDGDILSLDEFKAPDAASRYNFAASSWLLDKDGDKLDDAMQLFKGRKSLIVVFDGPLDSAERNGLLALPEIWVIYEYTLLPAAWIVLDVAHAQTLAALPFVEYVELDHPWAQQLDVSARSTGGRDGRLATLEDGSTEIGARGAWRGNPKAGYQGYAGYNTTVAIVDGGIDDSNPSIDDMNDDGDITTDPKVRVHLSAWHYVACTAPRFAIEDAARRANGPLPPNGPGGPIDTSQIPECNASITNRTAEGDVRTTTLAHATALAGIIAGTGDTTPISASQDTTQNQFDRWMFAGVAPRAWLADVNVFIGFDHDCVSTGEGSATCTGSIIPSNSGAGALNGPPGSTKGFNADSGRNAGCAAENEDVQDTVDDVDRALSPNGDELPEGSLCATTASVAFGIDLIGRYNEQVNTTKTPPDSPIDIAVIPLLDATSDGCGQSNPDTSPRGNFTFADAAIDSVINNHNLTVVVSAGNINATGIQPLCSPSTVASAITVGALDDQNTVTRDDDERWGPSNMPSAAQQGEDRLAKPELMAPGVNIKAPSSRTSSQAGAFYEVTGSSAAAAHVGGAAALILSAHLNEEYGEPGVPAPLRMGPYAIKTALIQSVAEGDEFFTYTDDLGRGEAGDLPDGLNDVDPQVGWTPQMGFGIVDVRAGVEALRGDILPWEGVETVVRLSSSPAGAKVEETVGYSGQILTVDATPPNSFWHDREAADFWRPRQGADAVPVNFAFGVCDETTGCDLTKTPEATAVTDEDGRFLLNVTVPTSIDPGRASCYIWTTGADSTEDRDGVLPTLPTDALPCVLNVRGASFFGCGEGSFKIPECLLKDPLIKKTFQNDARVDIVSGQVQLLDVNGVDTYTSNQIVRASWPGAINTNLVNTTSNSTGNSGALVGFTFRIRGDAGCSPLTISFTATPGSQVDGAEAGVLVCVSVGSNIEIQLDRVTPGTTFVNDGKPIPIGVQGRLTQTNGQGISGADLKINVLRGTLVTNKGVTTTDANGYFSSVIDLRQFLTGSLSIFVEYPGETAALLGQDQFLINPASSARIPLSIVTRPVIVMPKALSFYRGELATINGTLLNPQAQGLRSQEITVEFTGQTSFVERTTTDRQGRFRIDRVISADEPPGTATMRIAFPGNVDNTPAATIRNVEIRGRSFLSVFPAQVQRGADALIEGSLFDDTGRALPGQTVQLSWGPDVVGNATTNTLGRFAFPFPVSRDERVGPVTIRAAYEGLSQIDGSNAQTQFGVVSATNLLLEQQETRVQNGVEFVTKILDEQGRPIADQRILEVSLASGRYADQQNLTLLPSLDLSNSIAPEARIVHGYQFDNSYGISDGARLSVSIDQGDHWEPVQPRTGYSEQNVAAFGGGPGWSGATTGWFPQSVNLSDFKGEEDLRLRMRAASSPLNNQFTLGIDSFKLVDGETVVFSDDFESYGAKGTGDYWTLSSALGTGFVVGRETTTSSQRGVLGTNLKGTYAPLFNGQATSPQIPIPALQKSYAFLQYYLDAGNQGDYATLFAEDAATHKPILLYPLRESRLGTLPATDGGWKWLLYELPNNLTGKNVQFRVSFVSDATLAGKGFLLDEFRILSGVNVQVAPILDRPDPNRWQLSNFEQGVLVDVDRYEAVKGDGFQYRPLEGAEVEALAEAPFVKIETPFSIESFGEVYDAVTAYPEGILAMGSFDQNPSAACRADDAKCELTALNFGAPLFAVAWDAALVPTNATLSYGTVGIAPDREFVLQWNGLEAPGAGISDSSFQIRFHEDGDVEYIYGSLDFSNAVHNFGAHAVVAAAGPGGVGKVETFRRTSGLNEGVRVYLSSVQASFAQGCSGLPTESCSNIAALVPSIGGAYNPAANSEAIYASGFDLSDAGEAFLVARQFVKLGRGDNLLVQVRAGVNGLWRTPSVLQGGVSSPLTGLEFDREGQWSTVVYDLTPFVGQRINVRYLIQADGSGQDVGVAVRELMVLSGQRSFGTSNSDNFDSYLDTTRGGATWWSARTAGSTDATPPWEWAAHPATVPAELGARHLRLGDGATPVAADADFYLVSPPFNLLNAENPRLEYWQLAGLVDNLDGLVLEASTDGGLTFRPLRTEADTYEDFVPTLSGAGWVGPQFGFAYETFDLTPYASKDVRLRLEYATQDTPFASRWILDDFSVLDRLRTNAVTGGPVVYLHEDGRFTEDRWSGTPGAWTPHPLASAIEHSRDRVQPAAFLQATGSRILHRVPLPLGTPAGPLTATVVFPGVENTFGGSIKTSRFVVELSTEVYGVTLNNLQDNGAYIIRNRTFQVQGYVRDRNGAPVGDGLVQIELDGVVFGSATTVETGAFTASDIYVPPQFSLGTHKLNVKYAGDPDAYLIASEFVKNVGVKGLTSLIIENQVAEGDDFRVTIRIADDLGNPLARTAIVVVVNGEDDAPLELVTDPQGRAFFDAKVPVDRESLVVYDVQSLGTDQLIGQELSAEAYVPPAPIRNFPWWIVATVVALLAVGVLVYVLLLRRHRKIHLAEELALQIEKVEYALLTGDSVRLAIFELYRNFLSLLDRAGLKRPLSETPAELSKALLANLSPRLEAPINTVTDLFAEARYSEHRLREEDRSRVQDSLAKVRTSLAPVTPEAPAGGTA